MATRTGKRVSPDRRPPPRSAQPSPERHVWALAALFVPLVFCAIVGLGVFLMFHRQMAFFKPAPSGSAAPVGAALASAGGRHGGT